MLEFGLEFSRTFFNKLILFFFQLIHLKNLVLLTINIY